MEGDSTVVLERALQKRFALLEKSRIHRIAEKCFQADVPPIRERRIIAKGLGSVDRCVNTIKEKVDPAKVTYHPIDPEVIQNYNRWLAERRNLREDLNQLGNYTSWIQGKRKPTPLESRVLQTEMTKLNALFSEDGDSFPSTPDIQYSSLANSEGERSRSADSTPPPVCDGIRILQEYVNSRRLRLLDLFTQLDKNKNWSLEKSELSKMGLTHRQIEEILGPLERLSYRDVKAAADSLHSEQRLIKKCLRPPLPPIKSTDDDPYHSDTELVPDAMECPKTPSEDSRMSFSPLEWAQYSHRLVPSLESNLRDRILNFRDETWNEYQNLVARCKAEGIGLSVIALAKGLLAPGDRRWADCTKQLRQTTGLEIIKQQQPEPGKGTQDSMYCTETSDSLRDKVSKYYDSSLQYRDMAKKKPGEKMRLSTGVVMVRPRTDCWMSYEEYLALTANVRTRFRWVYGSQEPWTGKLLDKIRLCMPLEISPNQAVSLFAHTSTKPCVNRNGRISKNAGIPKNNAGYIQNSTRIRQCFL